MSCRGNLRKHSAQWLSPRENTIVGEGRGHEEGLGAAPTLITTRLEIRSKLRRNAVGACFDKLRTKREKCCTFEWPYCG